jgi:predicted TIM-barrel fold metal-dependent hydrolase
MKTTTPHRIDVHHHIFPPEYLKALETLGIGHAGNISIPAWSPESAIALMDRNGIATGITSIAAPGVHFGNDAAARDLARRSNEYSARLVNDHPDRFGSFAVLPMPDAEGTLREIEYALDTLKLDGVVMLASMGNRYLGDQAFDAVFDELNRRKAVIFIHPTVPVSSEALKLALPGALIEFVFDTTRAVANLIYSGTLERNPDMKIILSHAGGTIPYVAWRLSLGSTIPELAAKAPQGALAYLKRLYYDTAMSANPYALNSLRELVDPSQILFGSDTPFLPEPLIGQVVNGLETYPGFDAAERGLIERGNGLSLFPRLQNTFAGSGASIVKGGK